MESSKAGCSAEEERTALLRQLEDMYIPRDERTLRRVQKKVSDLDRQVRSWAQSVIDVLPRGLSLVEDEIYILSLFLAQQRRINLELDAQMPDMSLRARLARSLPFALDSEDSQDMVRAVHRVVASKLESEIDRACNFFCRDLNIPAVSDPAIDWRVSIRYMAQSLHQIASQIDMKRGYARSPRRFELALLARDMATEVVNRRRKMIAAFSPEPVT
jgi:hypothetical protein